MRDVRGGIFFQFFFLSAPLLSCQRANTFRLNTLSARRLLHLSCLTNVCMSVWERVMSVCVCVCVYIYIWERGIRVCACLCVCVFGREACVCVCVCVCVRETRACVRAV